MDAEELLTDAVERCVRYALNGERPYRRAMDFLLLLGKERHWTPDDLETVCRRTFEEIARMN